MINFVKKRFYFSLNTQSGKLGYNHDGRLIEVEKVTGKLIGVFLHSFTCPAENPGPDQDNQVFVKQIRLLLEDGEEEYLIPIGLGTFLASNALNSLLTLPALDSAPKLTILTYRPKEKGTGLPSKFLKFKIIHYGQTLKWKYGNDELKNFGTEREEINSSLLKEFESRFHISNSKGGEND